MAEGVLRNLNRSIWSRLLPAARAFWLVLLVLYWVFWIASMPRFFTLVNTDTAATVQMSAGLFAANAAAWDVSVPTWAVINTFVSILSGLVFSIVAMLVWWRLRTWFGLLTALVLLLTSSNDQGTVIRTAMISPLAETLWEFGALIWPAFILWLYLFPDGRPVPRRLRYIIGPLLLVFTLFFIVFLIVEVSPGSSFVDSLAPTVSQLGTAIIPILIVLVLGSQVYRYLRVSGPAERDQTKWFILGLVVALVLPDVIGILVTLPHEGRVAAFMAIPLGIGISVLRYRLWDIDVIIRKTLVYGALTALLALVYFGSIAVLQGIFTAVSGQSSAVVIVVSTLLIAALFAPLRRGLQNAIDRRFYRRKYDAEQVLARFAQTARDETDLDSLTTELARVVQETMQPERVSVWLREAPEPARQPESM